MQSVLLALEAPNAMIKISKKNFKQKLKTSTVVYTILKAGIQNCDADTYFPYVKEPQASGRRLKNMYCLIDLQEFFAKLLMHPRTIFRNNILSYLGDHASLDFQQEEGCS